jgi:hypothetical protein
VQGDPVFMRRVNGWLALFWVAMIPVSYELGWRLPLRLLFRARLVPRERAPSTSVPGKRRL